MRCCFVFAIALVTAIQSTLSAQVPARFSFETNVGPGWGTTTGDYQGDGDGLSVDVFGGARLRTLSRGALVAGFSGGAQGGGDAELCGSGPNNGGCGGFPFFWSIAALAGVESGQGTLRAMAGPAYLEANGRGNAWGGQARIDFAARMAGPIAFVVSTRAVGVPSYHRDTFWLFAFGMGLRLR